MCALVFLSHILPSISSHIPYFFFPRFIQNRTEISPFFFIQELLFAIIGPELVHFLRKEERMDCKKSKTTHYLIRAEWLWGGIFCFLLSIAAGIWEYHLLNMQKQEDINPYEGQLRIEVTYDNWHSGLVDSASCSLCGNAAKEQMQRWHEADTIGLILLNSWTIIEFPMAEKEEKDQEDEGIHYNHAKEISCLSSADPSRGMARANITWSDEIFLDAASLQQRLCQPCLDQVGTALSFWKWEQEEKEALPFCLIDFGTKELYPIQDTLLAYFIRDYWVELDFDKNSVNIKSYYLPKREPT